MRCMVRARIRGVLTNYINILRARRFLMAHDKTAAADILKTSGTRQVAAVYNNEDKNLLSVVKESHRLPIKYPKMADTNIAAIVFGNFPLSRETTAAMGR